MRLTILLLIAVLPLTANVVSAQHCDDVCVEEIRQGDSVLLRVNNRRNIPVAITFTVDAENMFVSESLPFTAIYDSKRKSNAIRLSVSNPARGWNYTYTYEWRDAEGFGATHDDSYVYRLPYTTGASFRVGQGFQGNFSHQGKNAIDWTMPEKTPVHAAREGKVLDVDVSNNKGGIDEKLRDFSNFIRILHPDGSIGAYLHLSRGGSAVNVGASVKRGQLIGYSGHTGYSSGPHLHVEVYVRDNSLERRTIPIKFYTENGRAEILREGKAYRAPAE